MKFSPVAKSTAAKTPAILAAEIERANMENEALRAEQAQRSQNMLGAASLYNQAMGDKTPIADFLSEALRGDTAGAAAPATAMLEPAGLSLTAPREAGLDTAGFSLTGAIPDALPATDFSLAGDALGAPAAEAAGGVGLDTIGGPVSALNVGAELAEGDVLGAAGDAGKGWLATLGPYGIAAAMALGLFGV